MALLSLLKNKRMLTLFILLHFNGHLNRFNSSAGKAAFQAAQKVTLLADSF